MSDLALVELVQSVEGEVGWGVHRHLRFDGEPVFVKTIPVTTEELENPESTNNAFGLPAHYHYGVGSAGFGAQRELAGHRRTTAWVLDGEVEHFPLLYHHRLVPLQGQTREIGAGLRARLDACWGVDPAIARYLDARSRATHAFALFVEHIPFVLRDWLSDHPDSTETVIDQARVATDVMRANGVAHCDAHLDNVLTDGARIYFTDFGLWMDAEFDLDDDERAFLETHRYLDIAEFVSSLSWPDRNGVTDHGPSHAAALAPFRTLIDEFSGTFFDLAAGGVTSSRYDDGRIRSLLEAGFTERIRRR